MSKHAWELDELFPQTKLIGYRHVLKKKLKPDDTINKYMVDLLAKSYK
jgi:hypothetical protein